MANIPGAANVAPGAYSELRTRSRGVSVPGGLRLAAIVGEGARIERLVNAALGGGNDGLNSTYTSTNGRDGRHFMLTYAPVISNRTTLYKNGLPLVGLEQANFFIAGGSFSNLYDYRIDITSGKIELQTAALIDQGGLYYRASTLNVGNGTINSPTLLDENAPTETWTIRCVSVLRDGTGEPIDGYARFIAQGSVSGIILDGYGQQIVWQSNGTTTDNTILQFSVSEGSVKFRENDTFTMQVKSGALVAGDSLVATYISEIDLNDPEFFTDPDDIEIKHGSASTANTLSLGAQLAFANSPPGIWACQAAPAIPRRVSYLLEASASGYDAEDDLILSLPLGVVPDVDSSVNFFITDSVTQTETQIIPNKVSFYDPAISAAPTTFIFGPSYHYSYTVIMENAVVKSGDDGTVVSVTGTTATLSSDTITFGMDDLSVTRSVHILSPAANEGTYTIVSVSQGKVTITDPGGFIDELDVEFEVIDTAAASAKVLFTQDLALSLAESLRATVVDTRDADFFDVGWASAYEALERIECDIVVPLPTQTKSSIIQAARIHCETMSNIRNRKERVLFTGAIRGLTPDNLTGTDLAAVEDIGVLEGIQGDEVSEILAGNVEDLTDYSIENSFGSSYRVLYMYPDEIVVQIGSTRTYLDGFYMAAAAAGFMSGIPNVNIPLTGKTITGFSILRDKLFRPSVIENIMAAGACLVQPAAGGGTVIWGKTTTNSGYPEEEELSVVFIRDRMSKSLRASFKGFPGQPEDDEGVFVGTLLSRANKTFQSFITQRLITKYRNIRVARDSVEPRQWNISGEAQPVYPVNWIYISVSVGLLE